MSEGDPTRRALRDVEWADRYSSSADDPLEDFYGPALRAAVSYDRATGFFRSSFFALTRADVGKFALRGGKARLLCSPDLEREDIEAIREGADARERTDHALRKEIERILGHPHSASGAEILAALYAGEHLEVRLAVPAGSGIFHDKFGIFSDLGGDLVSFVGSINENLGSLAPLRQPRVLRGIHQLGARAPTATRPPRELRTPLGRRGARRRRDRAFRGNAERSR